jgi:2-polyprenyl-3-methyl-5-hydroxy-6-metoxy-1,4-benzoquinol methylase
MPFFQKIKMINKLISFIRRKIFRIDKDRWDFQYARGQWEGLKTDEEMQRIFIARDLLKKYVPTDKILEIGCGEGIFFQNIPTNQYSFYEGVDISEVAILKTPKIEKSIFSAADMETYLPKNAPYDVIVLNEVLYYSKNPTKLLLKYAPFLKKSGFMLIGMFVLPKSEKIWEDLKLHFSEKEVSIVKQGTKVWIYKCLALK